ncbi:MAG: BolA family transcriptional regulator [bacterium]|nr:BolA family transcriptional regulator [bacterium]
MAMRSEDILKLLEDAFPGAIIQLEDSRGDQDHYNVVIESEDFFQKSRVQQHQMVYQALGTRMGAELHALSIKTKAITPQEQS